jgi:hypothetical protein
LPEQLSISLARIKNMITIPGVHPTRYRSTFASAGVLLLVAVSAWATTPVQVAKLIAEDSASNDFFGFSIALSDDTAVIGALRDDDNGVDSGSVHVFTRFGTKWSQQTKLTAADGGAGDEFGGKVALDGDIAVIGARLDDDKGVDSGSAYVFTRSGSTWSQQAKLAASDGAAGDVFGISVAISGDTVVIGADLADEKGSNSGAAYVFSRSGNTWSQQVKLTADDGAAGDLFGIRVTLSGDTALIGAARDDDKGDESGAAYVFLRSGIEWVQQAKLSATDGAANDRFGTRVAIYGDTAVIGAILGDAMSDNSGSAYVFTRSGSTWSQQAKLAASDGAADDVFGWSVALYGDTVMIGAPTSIIALPGGTGSAYVFEISHNEDID